MKDWENIINKATLGIAKQTLKASDLPAAIAEELELQETLDAEENFLRLSSLAYQYRQAGTLPLNLSALSQAAAEEEIKSYTTEKSNAVLKTILEEEHFSLLELWLKL